MSLLLLLSPAKTLDFETPVPPPVAAAGTRPACVAEAAVLIDALRRCSADEVAALMDLSPALAALNVRRYAAWRPAHTARSARPAALAFAGPVYAGLDAWSLDDDALAWAQAHVLILSGLYGALRPLDRIRPHRLEMGTRLAVDGTADLVGYWGDRLARIADRRARALRDGGPAAVVNLASQEYARAVDRRALRSRWVDCVFEDARPDGTWGVVGVHAKRARGLMARFAIERRAGDVEALKAFGAEGYAFAAADSSPQRLVFRRRAGG